ncbi:MAG: RIP metalloprotease RseP [Polyangia bacterium]|jgi:regulator of sigma E protease|nr:RIP metalloprotease RseP [Polyangia bacterium]
MNAIYFIVAFILLIGPLIFIHELGHFLFAKLFGVKVIRFSLGFGPAIPGFRRTWGETEYQVAAFPLGGYVKMLGEDPTEELKEEERRRSFQHVALWKRCVIVAAGPVFNLILPILIFFVAYLGIDKADPATVGTVLPGSPAAKAGLRPGDELVEIEGRPIKYWRDMRDIVQERPERATRFVVRRDGKEHRLDITPALRKRFTMLRVIKREGQLGILLAYTRAQVGIRAAETPAAQAGLRTGDLVTHVAGKPIRTWHDLEQALMKAAGTPVTLTVLRQTPPLLGFADLRLFEPAKVTVAPTEDRARSEGWLAYGIEAVEMYVDRVEPGSPAAKLGLAPGDRISALDGQAIDHWITLRQKLHDSSTKTFSLSWRRPDGTTGTGRFQQQVVKEKDEFKQEQKSYVFGAVNRVIYSVPEAVAVPFGARLGHAAFSAPATTWEIVENMVVGIAQIIRGNIPSDTIGGPIMLAYVARTAARRGWETFLFILAFISINLALINLLPIPILDGGHILVFTIEAIRRKPISLNARSAMNLVGLVFIVLLMVLAFTNDCNRYIFN